MKRTLGEKIRELREQKGLSQDALAEAIDVSRQTVSNWENDKVILDAEKLQRLCAVLGVSADALLNSEAPLSDSAEREAQLAPSPNKQRRLPVLLAVLAALLLAIAAVGFFFGGEDTTASVVLYPSAVWGVFFVLGGGVLIAAIVLFFKKR